MTITRDIRPITMTRYYRSPGTCGIFTFDASLWSVCHVEFYARNQHNFDIQNSNENTYCCFLTFDSKHERVLLLFVDKFPVFVEMIDSSEMKETDNSMFSCLSVVFSATLCNLANHKRYTMH